jgi:hypothetical protein
LLRDASPVFSGCAHMLAFIVVSTAAESKKSRFHTALDFFVSGAGCGAWLWAEAAAAVAAAAGLLLLLRCMVLAKTDAVDPLRLEAALRLCMAEYTSTPPWAANTDRRLPPR